MKGAVAVETVALQLYRAAMMDSGTLIRAVVQMVRRRMGLFTMVRRVSARQLPQPQHRSREQRPAPECHYNYIHGI